MTVSKTVNYLTEYVFGLLFIESFLLFYVLKQISSISIFHNHQKVLFALKDFIESDYIRVSYLSKNVNLLHHLLTTVLVLHVCFIYGFDCDLPTS